MTIEELTHELASGAEHVIEDVTSTSWRGGTTERAGGAVVQNRIVTVKRRDTGNPKQPWLEIGTLTLNEDGSIRHLLVKSGVGFNSVAPVLRGLAA